MLSKYLKFFRYLVFAIFILLILILFFLSFLEEESLTISDIILLITALLIAWYSFETLALVELTRIKDRPFLEIEFPRKGAKVLLKNLGPTPAYSPSVSSLHIDDSVFDFDPLFASRLPIASQEKREIWMHHKHKDNSSVVESMPLLHGLLIKNKENMNHSIDIEYYDKDGIKLKRTVFLKLGGNFISSNLNIYTTTSQK